MTTLVHAVERARDQFVFYAEQHRAKITATRVIPMSTAEEAATREKAIVNEELAAEMQAALDQHISNGDIVELETIQDYRFGSLTKGKDYAFARGLVIAPTHLPSALDAMKKDGFELLTVFGDTEAKKIGFLFRIVGPDPRVVGLLESNNREIERRRSAERLMKEFIRRVEAGEVRSKRTYAAFKAHLDNPYGE